MSEQNPPGDEPTQAYNPYNDDATRLERPVQPYNDQAEAPSLYAGGAAYGSHTAPPSNPGLVAPLVTVALLSILVGIGIGYLLFHSTDSGKATTTTTTSSLPAVISTTSTTSGSTTSTTEGSTSTTIRRTTTTEKSTSTSAKATTTTTAATSTSAKAATTSTTKAN